MLNEMRIGCENCQQCFKACNKQFPKKFIQGGAETCEGFTEEVNNDVIFSNMSRYVEEMTSRLSKEGIYV